MTTREDVEHGMFSLPARTRLLDDETMQIHRPVPNLLWTTLLGDLLI